GDEVGAVVFNPELHHGDGELAAAHDGVAGGRGRLAECVGDGGAGALDVVRVAFQLAVDGVGRLKAHAVEFGELVRVVAQDLSGGGAEFLDGLLDVVAADGAGKQRVALDGAGFAGLGVEDGALHFLCAGEADALDLGGDALRVRLDDVHGVVAVRLG